MNMEPISFELPFWPSVYAAAILTYVLVGVVAGRWQYPRSLARNNKDYPSSGDSNESTAFFEASAMMVFWGVVLPVMCLVRILRLALTGK